MSSQPSVDNCPFCGGTKITVEEGSTFRWRHATCGECGAQSGDVRADTMNPDHDSRERDASAKAIAEWNTRVTDQEVARLRDELAVVQALHKVAIKERDYERQVVNNLQAELNRRP